MKGGRNECGGKGWGRGGGRARLVAGLLSPAPRLPATPLQPFSQSRLCEMRQLYLPQAVQWPVHPQRPLLRQPRLLWLRHLPIERRLPLRTWILSQRQRRLFSLFGQLCRMQRCHHVYNLPLLPAAQRPVQAVRPGTLHPERKVLQIQPRRHLHSWRRLHYRGLWTFC